MQRQASGTNLRIKLDMTHRRAIKEETIAINRDWVYNQACRLSHDIHFVSNSFTKLIPKIRLSNNYFLIYKLNRHKIQVLIYPVSKESLSKYCI